MHRNTKCLTTALLAAVLCAVLVVPQAAAEPWTYEVDDVMASYGLDFYPDVGFENPRKNVSESTQSGWSGEGVSGGESVSPYVVESWDTYAARMQTAEIALQSTTQTDAYTRMGALIFQS